MTKTMIVTKIRKNIIANLIGRVWGIVSFYLFIPLYLKFLGIDAYGLVGFYSTLIGVLSFSDFGMTGTLMREMSRLSMYKDTQGKLGDLLRSYEVIYLYISLTLALAIWFLAPLIAQYWLRSNTISPNEIASAIRLMGIAVALQLPSGLYGGGLRGLEKQVIFNSLQITYGVVRGVGAVLILWLFSPTIVAFILWQIIVNALYLIVVRNCLWRSMALVAYRPRFKWLVFRSTWRYAVGISGIGLISILLTQTDKLVISKMMMLDDLGYYMIAWAVAQAPIIIANPISSAVFPRLSGLVAVGDSNAISQLYHKTCTLVAAIVIPSALTLVLFSNQFIYAWTGSLITAERSGMVTSLLVIGSIMQAIQIAPYSLALAHGVIKISFLFGLASVFLITPLLILLVHRYGVVGAGLSWMLMNLCILPPYIYFLYSRLLPGETLRKYLKEIGQPLLPALPCLLFAYLVFPQSSSRVLTFLMIGLVGIMSLAVSVLTVRELRQESFKIISKLLGVSYGT